MLLLLIQDGQTFIFLPVHQNRASNKRKKKSDKASSGERKSKETLRTQSWTYAE